MLKNTVVNQGRLDSVMLETNARLTKEVSMLDEEIKHNAHLFDTPIFNGFLRDKITRIQNQIREMNILEGGSSLKVDSSAQKNVDCLLDLLYGPAAETYGTTPGIPLDIILPHLLPYFKKIAESNGILKREAC
jgi:hypothetical protein